MKRQQGSSADASWRDEWNPVTHKTPCPICGKASWCAISRLTGNVLCMRVQSKKPRSCGQAGTGYLHEQDAGAFVRAPIQRKAVATTSPHYWVAYMARLTPPHKSVLAAYASSLSVSMSSLVSLCAAEVEPGLWAYPMRTGSGRICGIRLRRNNGEKFAVRGSTAGSFFPLVQPPGDVLVVVEGPTSCAAGLTLELPTIGASSAGAGNPEIWRYMTRNGYCHALIVADNDSRINAMGQFVAPGMDGATRLAKTAPPHIDVSVVLCPSKDIRQWTLEEPVRKEDVLLLEPPSPPAT